MLRPKSALFYIDEITGVSDDLLQLMVSEINAEKGVVDDVSPFLYRWSLEAVGSIFLDTRLDFFFLDTRLDMQGIRDLKGLRMSNKTCITQI